MRWRICWRKKHNIFWHEYGVVVAAGASAGIGLDALPPVRKVIGSGYDTQDHHTVVWQAYHWRHRATVVVHPDVAQSQVAGVLLPGGIPRAIAVVNQESQWGQPKRGRDPQAGLLCV